MAVVSAKAHFLSFTCWGIRMGVSDSSFLQCLITFGRSDVRPDIQGS